jgi:hypothetical protein
MLLSGVFATIGATSEKNRANPKPYKKRYNNL